MTSLDRLRSGRVDARTENTTHEVFEESLTNLFPDDPDSGIPLLAPDRGRESNPSVDSRGSAEQPRYGKLLCIIEKGRVFRVETAQAGLPSQAAGDRDPCILQIHSDQAESSDAKLIDTWKGTIDVFLVFDGLLSAVITAFLVQSSAALQDSTTVNSYLLSELISIQMVAINDPPAGGIKLSAYTPGAITGQSNDFLVNGLWLASLTVVLSSAFMAVIIRVMIQHYLSITSRTSRDRVFRRLKLHVPTLLITFAIFLDFSLSSFIIGLGYYFYPLHAKLSHFAVSVTSTVTLFTYGIVVAVNSCRRGRE